MTRLEQLRKFYEEDQHDPFNIYALALELTKSDQQEAAKLFEDALTQHPAYLPSYYHAAKLYEALKVKDRAIQIFEQGINQAKRQNEFKALRELQSALSELIYE